MGERGKEKERERGERGTDSHNLRDNCMHLKIHFIMAKDLVYRQGGTKRVENSKKIQENAVKSCWKSVCSVCLKACYNFKSIF